jgi:hypothetical protein
MDLPMAYVAKGNEIFFHIASQGTARLNVMDLEILGSPASLTSPAIAPQHLPAKLLIGILVQAEPALSGDARSHDACGIRNKNSRR